MMSKEPDHGWILKFHYGDNDATYFLYDTGTLGHEEYSLFPDLHRSGKLATLAMPLDDAIQQAWREIENEQAWTELKERAKREDQQSLNGNRQ